MRLTFSDENAEKAMWNVKSSVAHKILPFDPSRTSYGSIAGSFGDYQHEYYSSCSFQEQASWNTGELEILDESVSSCLGHELPSL